MKARKQKCTLKMYYLYTFSYLFRSSLDTTAHFIRQRLDEVTSALVRYFLLINKKNILLYRIQNTILDNDNAIPSYNYIIIIKIMT